MKMRTEWLTLQYFVLTVLSIHLPGVDFTINNDKVKLECLDGVLFDKLKLPKFNESKRSFEINNCLTNKTTSEIIKEMSINEVKSIEIKTVNTWKSDWLVENLETLSFKSYVGNSEDVNKCYRAKNALTLSNLKSLRSLELILESQSSRTRCPSSESESKSES